ncbi:hypothetical protein BDL97_08G097100 [Sphagnum fallax]|nr:hypothetical protein BDL97_08G097100 [Sphagnum fallax]
MRLPAAHHPSTESRFDFVSSSGKKKPHQKTNKRGATICKRKGSTNLETTSGFSVFFFFQYWVFFRSVCEKLRKDLKFRNSKLATSSSSSLTDFRL